MRVLCLDWWEMGPNELDGLVKGCTGLAKLRVGITFPIVKLVSYIAICPLPTLELPSYHIPSPSYLCVKIKGRTHH